MTTLHPIKGCAFDAVLVDRCGRAIAGPESYIQVCGTTDVTMTPVYYEGEDVFITDGCDNICVDEP